MGAAGRVVERRRRRAYLPFFVCDKADAATDLVLALVRPSRKRALAFFATLALVCFLLATGLPPIPDRLRQRRPFP